MALRWCRSRCRPCGHWCPRCCCSPGPARRSGRRGRPARGGSGPGAILLVSCRRARRAGRRRAHDALAPHGLLAQALRRGDPARSRRRPAVPLASGAGYISSYEMSDRLFYAATQFFTMTFLVPARGDLGAAARRWQPDDARHLLRRDGRLLGGWSPCSRRPACWCAWSRWRRACSRRTGPRASGGPRRDGLRPAACVQRRGHAPARRGPQAALHGRALRPPPPCSTPCSTPVSLLAGADRDRRGDGGLRWAMAGVYLVLLRTAVPQTIGQELVG